MGYRARKNDDGTHDVIDGNGNIVPNSRVKSVKFPSRADATKDGDVNRITSGHAVVVVDGEESEVPLVGAT